MKVYKTSEIKNIALLGSKGSGKTTLAEAMLYECGVIKRRGNVESGNTVSDYFPVEKEYGYSVFSTIFYAEFLGCQTGEDIGLAAVRDGYECIGISDSCIAQDICVAGVGVYHQGIMALLRQFEAFFAVRIKYLEIEFVACHLA